MYTHCKLSTTISICSGSISTCIYWYGYKRNPIIVKHEIPGILIHISKCEYTRNDEDAETYLNFIKV